MLVAGVARTVDRAAAHDFSFRYVALVHERESAESIYMVTAFWGGQAGSLLFWALILTSIRRSLFATNRGRNRELMPYVDGRRSPPSRSFSSMTTVLRRESVRAARLDSARRHGAESAAAESRDGYSSAESLSGLRRDRDSLRVRHRGADHAQARRGVARRRAPLGARLVVLQHDRHRARHVVGVCRAWLGRLLGVGSRRERVVPAVADNDRVPALDHGSGEARDAAQVERDARGLRFLLAIFGTFITRSGSSRACTRSRSRP